MSKFSFDRLKGGGGRELPTMKFHKSVEDLQILDDEVHDVAEEQEFKEKVDLAVGSPPIPSSSSYSNTPIQSSSSYSSSPNQSIGIYTQHQTVISASTSVGGIPVVQPQTFSQTTNTSSQFSITPSSIPVGTPDVFLEERLLGTFAKLAPDTMQETAEGSWLTQVKGKLAKTVDNSLERYAELRAERLRHARLIEHTGSIDLEGDNLDVRSMSHSHSEMALKHQTSSPQASSGRPHSQIFDFDISDWSNDLCTSTPESGGVSADQAGAVPPVDLPAAGGGSTFTPETPTKARKRFGIPFLERAGSPNRTAAPTGSLSSTETPKRSIRSFMRSYVSKPQTEDKLSSSPTLLSSTLLESPLENPFSGTEYLLVDSEQGKKAYLVNAPLVDEDAVEAVEEEVDKLDKIDVVADLKMNLSVSDSTQHSVPLGELVNPIVICILAVVNLTGLFPSWLSGFISGLIVCGIFLVWFLLKLYPAVSYTTSRKPTATTHITVHEEPLLVQAWMNLLPTKFQHYDVDNYEVKNTISVRITIEHHMLRIEYPEKNIPKRLNVDECVPADLKFHFHTEHIDLTTARISLLPEGIAGKRMFSKKYPIEIRPNSVLAPTYLDDDITRPTLVPDITAAKAEESDFRSAAGSRPESLEDETDKEVEDLEEDGEVGFENVESEEKVFYLFARADREKEDIYKGLMDGHYFLADTLQDTNTTNQSDNTDRRETVRQRKHNFSEFMSKIMEPPSPVTPLSPQEPSIDWCIHFFNVYLHRIFYDIHRSAEIKTLLKTRIYNKLLKIKITQWFKQINVTEIDMGSNLPKIQWVSRPTQNERGLWVHLGIEYGGIASATIETCGFNLGEDHVEAGGVQLKALLEENPQALPIRPASPGDSRRVSSRIEAATNSDEEDSAESDSEESGELHAPSAVESPVHRTRWWEMVGNSELVKTGINRLSNSEWWKTKTSKKITLQLEVVSLKGVIVLNIPPPPSDRIWYGFKKKPELDLRLLPYYGDIKLGEDNSLFSTAVNKGIHVLVNRLKDELDKFILLPNMDDLPIKIMSAFPTSTLHNS